jgi:ceramide glucosyltransferase
MSPDLAIAVVLVPAWAYLIGAAMAVMRFTRRPLPTPPDRPAVSVMKPLHGAEPGLYENLRSFA